MRSAQDRSGYRMPSRRKANAVGTTSEMMEARRIQSSAAAPDCALRICQTATIHSPLTRASSRKFWLADRRGFVA